MVLHEFYKEVRKLLPYSRDENLPFKDRLKKALSRYVDLAKQYITDPVIISDIKRISSRIIEIVGNYEKGLQSKAFTQLQNLIQGSTTIKPKIDLAKNVMKFDAGKPMSFYRIRQMPSIYQVKAEEMFHIPLNKRGIVKTQRYSTSGYPCLYLGESIYGCWEEMRRPSMQTCAVARLQCDSSLNIVNLSVMENEKEYDYPYNQRLIPLLIACMVPVANHDDTYKPEYIIPQLIIEWILKNRTNEKIDGVCYTSTHINNEFDFPDSKFLNYALPVYSTDPRKKYCNRLCELFKITKPTTNDIEKLKSGYPVDGGEYGLSEEDQQYLNYELSDFGNLEKRLSDQTRFPLESLDS